MKETSFIQQNKDKWAKFEQLHKSKNSNPDELSELFVEITEDLSYARTFYPRRSVRVYLNGMAQHVFTSLHKIKRDPFGKFLDFWKRSLPLEMYRSRRNLFYAFLIFGIASLIGVVSTANDLNFARVVLSDHYVDMTNSFIEDNDPMAVYKQSGSYSMFVMIFFNNIQVAFYCFILGLFFSLGTAFFLVANGIMLGSFQSYFYFKGLTKGVLVGKQLLLTTFLTIWIHGAFEISAIIISGAAGLTLGNGLLFPGSYTHMQSLQITAKRGIKIMVGLIPFFFIAAIFESWVTRHTEMPDFMKWTIILGSFAVVLGYFVIYPFIVARKYPEDIELNEEPFYHPPIKIEKYKIRQINELFSDAFGLYRMAAKFLMKPLFLIILPLNFIFLCYIINQNQYFFGYTLKINQLLAGVYAIKHTYNPANFLLSASLFWLNVTSAFHALNYAYSDKKTGFWKSWFSYLLKKGYRFILPTAIFFMFFLSGQFALFFLSIFLSPVIFGSFVSESLSDKNFITSFFNHLGFNFRTWGNGFLLFLIFIAVTFCFLMIFSGVAMIGGIVLETIEWHIITLTDNYWAIQNGLKGIIFILFFHMIIPLYLFAYTLLHYSQLEKEKAIGLFERLKRFGQNNKTFESDFDEED